MLLFNENEIHSIVFFLNNLSQMMLSGFFASYENINNINTLCLLAVLNLTMQYYVLFICQRDSTIIEKKNDRDGLRA